MNKENIVIASILKPVDDTRMYEKMGLSLASLTTYHIHIIGFWSKGIPKSELITFHPIFNFSRLSLGRLLAPFKCYQLLRKLQPQTLIVNTHELLIIGAIYSLFHKTKFIYDVRENYYRNILFTAAFPKLVRPILAHWVRMKEYVSQPFVDHYFLAEQSYEQEFSFTRKKSTILENKYQPIDNLEQSMARDSSGSKLLFTGTLAESTGVFHAIDLAIALHTIDPNFSLEIIGYSPIQSITDRILSKITRHPFITLLGGNKLVPHQEVIAKIKQANFGIIFYPSNKSTINSTPTKLYEYLANQLPIIVQNNPKWQALCEAHSAGIVIDFDGYQVKNLLHKLKNTTYYLDTENEQFLWASEAAKLLNHFNS
jgi:glycosyltransferase involved in cell wall biosynthesis